MNNNPEVYTRDERLAKLAAFLEKIGRMTLLGRGVPYRSYEITLPVSPGALRFAVIDATGSRHVVSGRYHELACAMYEWMASGIGQCPADAILTPKEWMFEAAYRIDAECGLGRFDYALKRAAEIIAEQYAVAHLAAHGGRE